MLRPFLLLFLPAVATAFMPKAYTRIGWSHIYAQEEEEEEEEPKLVLDGVDDLMKRFKSKFPTSEADYLAAARKRAEEARPSVNSKASDEDWHNIASQKSSLENENDDWEASLKEAGNDEAQILIPLEQQPTDDNDEGDEPKLLLF